MRKQMFDPVEGVDAVGDILRHTVRDGISKAKGRVDTKETEVTGDVVTDADFIIQDALQRKLAAIKPDAIFLGEEGFKGLSSLEDRPIWIVDPLDGTLNFACDLPFYGSSVALVMAGMPVLGVVYDYGSDVIYDAVVGQGARIDAQPMTWDATLAARSPVGISSGFLAWANNTETMGDYIPALLGSRFRIFGSQAVQLCWAAAGRLRLNINLEAKLWDDAAGALICEEAGAGYAALNSTPLFPLADNTPALAGLSLFSLSGDPALVASCEHAFKKD